MKIIEEIQQSKKKPKELVMLLTKEVKKNKKLVSELVDCIKTGSDVEKGICLEVTKYVSKDNPGLTEPCIDTLIKYINYDAPKVKWGTARVIGNTAKKFPEKAGKAVPNLLVNTKDEATVTRWCAAFALSEIAKYNVKLQKGLVSRISEIVKKEKNSGVKNVYLKALKAIDK